MLLVVIGTNRLELNEFYRGRLLVHQTEDAAGLHGYPNIRITSTSQFIRN